VPFDTLQAQLGRRQQLLTTQDMYHNPYSTTEAVGVGETFSYCSDATGTQEVPLIFAGKAGFYIDNLNITAGSIHGHLTFITDAKKSSRRFHDFSLNEWK
jgi:hypothetical protein